MARRTSQPPQRSGAADRTQGREQNPIKMIANIATLHALPHAELKEHWIRTIGTAAPKGLSRRLLIHALAYELQTRQQSRLKPAVKRRLRELASHQSSVSSTTSTPGTRLMREWRGTVHVVDVTEDGLVWNGRVYGSLSAIARTITGTRWSGNRFFGLRKRSDAAAAPGSAPSGLSSRDDPQAGDMENLLECAKSDQSLNPQPEPVS